MRSFCSVGGVARPCLPNLNAAAIFVGWFAAKTTYPSADGSGIHPLFTTGGDNNNATPGLQIGKKRKPKKHCTAGAHVIVS